MKSLESDYRQANYTSFLIHLTHYDNFRNRFRKILTNYFSAKRLFRQSVFYIPLRALGQSLGFHIYYDADTEIIVVNNPDMTTAVRNERLAEGKAYIK